MKLYLDTSTPETVLGLDDKEYRSPLGRDLAENLHQFIYDKLIENNETDTYNKIYSIESLSLFGMDAYEASIVSSVYNDSSLGYYYLDGNLFSSSYQKDFAFSSDGYYILKNTNSSLSSLTKGCVVVGAQIEGNKKIDIIDRNDLIFLLLEADKGDKVTLYYNNSSALSKSISITL